MKKTIISNFFLGLMIAFTNSVIILSATFAMNTETRAVPVSLIIQAFILSALCSTINLIYQADRLSFLWQSVLGYMLTTSAIISCGLVFDWYGSGWGHLGKGISILLSFFAYSFFYLITWIIIWNVTKAKKKMLNDKLDAYKLQQ